MAPGDPFANEKNMDPTAVASLKQKFHAGSAREFLCWYPYNVIVHGDFGDSMQYRGFTVNDIISMALPVSVTLGLFAVSLAVFSREPNLSGAGLAARDAGRNRF